MVYSGAGGMIPFPGVRIRHRQEMRGCGDAGEFMQHVRVCQALGVTVMNSPPWFEPSRGVPGTQSGG